MKNYVIYHEGSRLFVGSYEECIKYAETMDERSTGQNYPSSQFLYLLIRYDMSTLEIVEERAYDEAIELAKFVGIR